MTCLLGSTESHALGRARQNQAENGIFLLLRSFLLQPSLSNIHLHYFPVALPKLFSFHESVPPRVMATSTNSPTPIEKPEPSLGFSAQKKPVTSSTTGESSPDTPKVQSPFCSQSPDLEEAASAQPTPAKTSDPSGAGGDPMAASVASIAPHDSILSNKIAPTADNDDKATSPSQDVSPEDPDSPVTPPRSRGAPVSLSTQVEPQESPESPSGSHFTD